MKHRLLPLFILILLCGFLFPPVVQAAPRQEEPFVTTQELPYPLSPSDYPFTTPIEAVFTKGYTPYSGMFPMSVKWQSSMIIEKTIAKREEGLDMKGILPTMTEDYGLARDTINEQIDKAALTKVTAAKEIKARSITFDYAVYETDSLVSLILLSTVVSASSKTEVTSVNFDPASGRLVSLSEAAGVIIKPLAEKLIEEKIRRSPEKYNTSFTNALSDQQAYYMENDKLVLLFNEFSLRSGAEGITPLELLLSNIQSVTITKEDYTVKPGYNLKMVPLRMICEGIGYEVLWSQDEARIEILRDKVLVMEMEPGANNYLVRDKVRSLEAAPEFYENVVYVPISFFDQILSLITYSVDKHDSITFLSYHENN